MSELDHIKDYILREPKVDAELGAKVNAYLLENHVETPFHFAPVDIQWAHRKFAEGIKDGMNSLGLNMADDSLSGTPKRYADMMVGELTRGLWYDLFPACTTVQNKMLYNQMVLVDGIQVMSLCEHHLQTIDGVASIAYIPDKKVLGLSKFARVVEFFARRPQVQERLTEQVFRALEVILETSDIAVVIKATHYCMKARGAQQHASLTTTDKMGGRFMTKPELRQEFLHAIS